MRQDELVDIVQYLVTSIGLRPATSLAEAQAAAYIDGRFRHAGMKVNAESFPAARTRIIYPLLSLLGLMCALLSHWWTILALLLACWLLVITIFDAIISPLPPLTRSDTSSQNIIGTRASKLRLRWRVVILAPLDSPANADELHQSYKRFIGRIIAFTLIIDLALLIMMNPEQRWWYYGQAIPVVYLATTLFPRPGDRTMSVGSAGALAVVVNLAGRLSHLRTIELWTIALGAIKTDTRGLQDLLSRYPFPKTETLFFIVENIDYGTLTYIPYAGVLRRQPCDALLKELATQVQQTNAKLPIRAQAYQTVSPITAILHAHGYRTLTIASQGGSKPLSSQDILSHINPILYEHATQFLYEMVERLDKTI